jgi:hypothetical protein
MRCRVDANARHRQDCDRCRKLSWIMTSPSFQSSRSRRSVWLIPVVGFGATYLLVAGVSLSNVDIRTQAEIVGLAALVSFPALGFVLTWRAGKPPLGAAVNSALVVLIVLLASVAYVVKRPSARSMRDSRH